MSLHDEQVMTFIARQLLDLLPVNFVAAIAEVLKRTIEEKGQTVHSRDSAILSKIAQPTVLD